MLYDVVDTAQGLVADPLNAAAKITKAQADMLAVQAKLGQSILHYPGNPLQYTPAGIAADMMLAAAGNMARWSAAGSEVVERATRQYPRPEFGLPTTLVDGQEVAVREEVVMDLPFCNLLHFKRDLPDGHPPQPKVLLFAPLSGHYATLLRGTVEAFLPGHDVYITDWHNPRDVPLSAGDFSLDTYMDYTRKIFQHFEGHVHAVAVCQPSVPVLATVALMEEDGDPHVPQSLTLMGGPIDTRHNPTHTNKTAKRFGLSVLRQFVTEVPARFAGAGRKVIAGFTQLSAFMFPNLDKHVKADADHFHNLIRGDGDSAEAHRKFYDEYRAVMDLVWRYIEQTNIKVFLEHHLPRGIFKYREGTSDERLVRPELIRRTALMTVEGEKDDITGLNQTQAALDLCSGIPANRKRHYTQPKVGHYGIFNGRRFREEVMPHLTRFIHEMDGARPTKGLRLVSSGPAPGQGTGR